MVLFGDSHAAQWAPALKTLAEDGSWRAVYYTKSSCPGVEATSHSRNLGRAYTECDTWRAAVVDSIRALRPNVVLMAAYYGYDFGERDWTAASEAVFSQLAPAAGAVVVLHDSPEAPADVPHCLSRRSWYRTLGLPERWTPACDFPAANPAAQVVAAAQAEAASRHPNVFTLDLTERICPGGTCRAERGPFVTYRDSHHLTASYVVSMAKDLEQAMRMREPAE